MRAAWGSPQAAAARRAHGSPLPQALGAAAPDGLRREAPGHAGTRRGRPARGRAQPGADAFCRLQAQNGADAGAGIPVGRGERRGEPLLVPGGGWGSLTPLVPDCSSCGLDGALWGLCLPPRLQSSPTCPTAAQQARAECPGRAQPSGAHRARGAGTEATPSTRGGSVGTQ